METFNKGDKYIYFKDDGEVEIGTIDNISISQVSEVNGYCYEVINLISGHKVISLFQTTKGRVYKLNHMMTPEELAEFKTGKFYNPFPTKYE